MSARVSFVLLSALILGNINLGSAYAETCIDASHSRIEIEREIEKAASAYQLDPAFLWAIVEVESAFDSCAVSPAGARGLMQLMPATAADLGVTDVFDVKQNLDGGARHMAQLIATLKIPQLYIAAYNAGLGAVKAKGYVPNYRETRVYLRRILRAYQHKTGVVDDFLALQMLTRQVEDG